MEKKDIRKKTKARQLALQALYQWHLTQHEASEIDAQFRVANNMDKVDIEHFTRLLYGIIKEDEDLFNTFKPYLDRPLEQLNPIELTALKIGTYELLYCLEVPYKIVLDEIINLTKAFGAQDGFRYVNGVLNQLAQKIRTIEINGMG